jgi:hypothetical protein
MIHYTIVINLGAFGITISSVDGLPNKVNEFFFIYWVVFLIVVKQLHPHDIRQTICQPLVPGAV